MEQNRMNGAYRCQKPAGGRKLMSLTALNEYKKKKKNKKNLTNTKKKTPNPANYFDHNMPDQ